ncbi:hypothetical protein E3N88_22407 [Mikania micrantha]|uniref:Ubiquitin-like protease family profile domain-containing protein n=1 Tax=Mikania micrantha TaxID=192012 RepID=A0A5N6NA99_9ASTR|nr:hypothetical protein E3N88_22407 [Mikania micrantha]
MSNPREKNVADNEQYHSQPTKNSLSWVPNNWRRLSLKNPASSSSVPKTTMNDVTKDVMDEAAKVPVEDGQDKNESHTLSRDAMEFYNNGDAPYCYSRILGLNKLHTDFWGVLLGYLNDGCLNAIHIEGWVRRMMFLRGAKKRTNPSIEFDWTILPPQFHSEMYDYRTKYGSEYANGMNELYPPFWEVQYIYIPIYVQAIEDWLLVQINLCTMELTQYWCNQKYSKHYGRLIHNGVLQKFDMFFDKLLDAVSYWRRVIHGPYKPQEKGYLKTGLINDDYLPKIGGALGKDSGVFLCMLMYKLVHKKAFTMEGGIEEHCMKFRHVMADQFYKTRFFPDE